LRSPLSGHFPSSDSHAQQDELHAEQGEISDNHPPEIEHIVKVFHDFASRAASSSTHYHRDSFP
jgi:hypothetical protein